MHSIGHPWRLSLLGLLLLVACTEPQAAAKVPSARMVRQPIERVAPDFALVDQFERPLALGDLRGKAVLLTFVYTACADVCPLISANFAALQRQLTAELRGHIFLLSVTTDPETDLPAVLAAYGSRFGADFDSWAFLTGSPEAVGAVWQGYGMTVRRRADGAVDHPAWTLLVDPGGQVRYRYHGGALDVGTLLADLRTIGGERADGPPMSVP